MSRRGSVTRSGPRPARLPWFRGSPCGSADDAEGGQGLVLGAVAGGHHAGGGKFLVGALVADPDGHRSCRAGLAEELEQDDVLLERSEEHTSELQSLMRNSY